MPERGASDLEAAASAWAPWIESACATLGVDPALVDLSQIHDLSGAVAREVVRPMGPVAAYLWGVAVATHPDADPAELRRAIAAAAGGDSEA